MAYSTIIDERYIGFTSYAAGSLDVRDSFFDSSSVFGQLVQGTLAYGELTYNNGAFGLLKDVDIYDLGTLSTGYYSIDVDDFTWDFSNFDSGSVSSFSLLNSFGQTLDTKYSTFANIDFSVNSPGQYYVTISGPVGLDAQYTVSYDRTGDLVTNNLAIFSQVTYYGSMEVGNSIAASVSYFDADGNSDNSVGIGWYIDGIFQGLTDSSGSFALLPEHEGKILSFRFSFYDDVGNFELSNFYVAGTVTNPNDAPTGDVVVTGTVRQGETITANVSALADADGFGTLSYQWKADGTDISGATSSTYTLTQGEVGKVVTVAVSYTDDGDTAESVLSAATAAVENVNDNPTGTVTITGTTTQGQTLTAENTLADADGLGTLSYQWKADGTDIEGATAITYTLTQAEVGKVVTVAVSYTDGQGTPESVLSGATASVTNVYTSPTGDVVITGTATQGATLTADASALDDADGLGTLSYQWKANGTDISGATSNTYTLTQDEVGKVITVAVSYTDGEGTAQTISSVFIPDVINLTVTVGSGSLYGGGGAIGNVFYINGDENPSLTLIRGNTYVFDQSNATNGSHPLRFLTADNASYTEGVTANGTPGTLGATITFIVPADAPGGLQYYCTVHGKGMGGAIATEQANVVANINDSPTGAVTITGAVRQGEVMTADTSALADADGLGALSYQWKADGIDIFGATVSTFTPTQVEVGKVIAVVVSYTDGGDTQETVTSSVTPTVANVNNAPVGVADTLAATEDTAVIYAAGDLLGNDTDADGDTLSIKIVTTINGGTVVLNDNGSVTFTPTPNFNGSASFSYIATDGTADTAATTATVNVAAETAFVIGTFGTEDSGIFAAYEALAASLDNNLPGYTFSVQSYESYEAMSAAIVSGDVDIAELGAAGFASIVTDDPDAATPLLTTLSPDGTSAYFSLGITPAESALTIEGLTTTSEPITIGVVSTLSTSGFLAPLVELRDLGIDLLDPPANITMQFLGSHEAVIAAVANGDIDLGFTWARGDAIDGWLSGALPHAVANNVIELDDINVVWQSNPLLNGPIVVSADVPDASHDALAAAIEAFTDANTEAAATMFGGAYHGLTEVSVYDYQIYIDLANLNDDPSGGVTITGAVREGEVVTADISALADADGLGALSYQWKADGLAITGATSSTYTLTQDEVGKTITVEISYTDNKGALESVTSSQTILVGTINQAPIVRFEINAFSFNLIDPAPAVIFDTFGTLSFFGSADATASYTYVVPDPADRTNGEVSIDSFGINPNSIKYNDRSVDLSELNFVFGESFELDNQVSHGFALGFNDLKETLAGSLPDRIAFLLGESAPIIETQEDLDFWISQVSIRMGTPFLSLQPQTDYLISDLPNITISHPVAIFGNLIVGSDLMVSVADWIDPDGTSNATFSYQWQADGIDISGATLSTFTLTQAQVDKVITVAVSYTDDEGTPERVFSESSTPVTNTNDPDVSLSLTTTLIDRFGDALFNVDVSAYEVQVGEHVFLREVSTSDTSSVFEIVAKPTEAVSSVDFELLDFAGLVDFQVGSALNGWSIQSNTNTPDTVRFAGFGAINGSQDLAAGQETVLATFATSTEPDFVIEGIFLNTTDQADISVGEVTAVSKAGNVTVHEVARGSDIYLHADKSIDLASDRAITANDALQALRLAVGLTKSDGTAAWHDYIAADINKDGQVTANDALNILKFAVGLTDGPSADWVFVDSDADWSAIGRRNTSYEEGIWIEDVVADMSVNLTGILVGDVNGSYVV